MAKEKKYILEINCETGEQTQREYTAEEYAQAEIDAANAIAENERIAAEEQAKAEAKASALAKLTALGLSEDEAKAIVG